MLRECCSCLCSMSPSSLPLLMILWPELSAAPDNIKVVTDNDTTEEQEEPVEYAAEHEQ